jgi:catechol 2,3-dioxygenase-like lactoylglutathione lyase family enzyme
MDMKLELVPIPVADVDRSRAFYVEKLGFALDVDVQPAEGVRVVQLTPPGSACSISIGYGLPVYEDSVPGSLKGIHLVAADIESSRTELIGRGVDVSPIQDVGGGVKYAGFADPDGNSFTFQEMEWRTGGNF